MIKIGIIGAHGCGKTDIALQVASRIKSQYPGLRVDFLSEVVRTCPLPINRLSTIESQQWIYHAQMVKELEQIHRTDILVCDRSVLDGFIYSLYQRFYDFFNAHISNALTYFQTYGHILFVKPSLPPAQDGVRDVLPEYQEEINYLFMEMIRRYKLKVMEGRDVDAFCSQIFKDIEDRGRTGSVKGYH